AEHCKRCGQGKRLPKTEHDSGHPDFFDRPGYAPLTRGIFGSSGIDAPATAVYVRSAMTLLRAATNFNPGGETFSATNGTLVECRMIVVSGPTRNQTAAYRPRRRSL